MKFIENLTDEQINKLLKPLNLKLTEKGENNKIQIFNKPEKTMFLFCERLEETELDKFATRIFNNMFGGINSIYPDGPTLCLTDFSLTDAMHRTDYSQELYYFVINNKDFDEKFKKEYKKGFIKYYSVNLDENENNL